MHVQVSLPMSVWIADVKRISTHLYTVLCASTVLW